MRLALPVLALLLAAAPPCALAVPVAIYPLDRTPGDDDAPVVQSLLDAGVHQAARRSDVRPASPLLAAPRCGAARTASRACLADGAGAGLVLRATVRRAPGVLVVSLEAVDGQGRAFGPVGIGLETAIQNSEPLTRAIVDLAARAEAPAPAVAAAPATSASPAAPAAPPGPAAASWQARAAPWLGALGLGLATVGGMYAGSSQAPSDTLARKRAAGTYTEGDARWADESARERQLSQAFLVAGGACAAAGLVLWSVAPAVAPVPGGAAVGVTGKF